MRKSLLFILFISSFVWVVGGNQNEVTEEEVMRWGRDMFVNGIAYDIVSKEDRTVEVAPLFPGMLGEFVYKADTFRIPETVIWHDTLYTVVAIGTAAFSLSNVKHVEIPSTVTEIKRGAFSNVIGLEELVIPNSVKIIGDRAFGGSIMEETYYPKNVVFPETIEVWGEGIFAYAWGRNAPSLPDYVTYIPVETYCDGGLNEWPGLPKAVEVIGEMAFFKNLFDSIYLPESLKEIHKYAFNYCSKLKSVTIPANVTYIGKDAFGGSNSWWDYDYWECYLDTMRMMSRVPCINESPLTKTVLIVPDGTKELYEEAWDISSPVYEESELAGIRPPLSPVREERRFTLGGWQVSTPTKGINIIKSADGKTKKVFVK